MPITAIEIMDAAFLTLVKTISNLNNMATIDLSTLGVHLTYSRIHANNTTSNIHVVVCDTPAKLQHAIVTTLSHYSAQAIKEHDYFTVAWSGGSLPKLVGQALLSQPSATTPEKWRVFYADERLVKLNDPDSNHAEVNRQWLAQLSSLNYPNVVATINESLIENPTKCAENYAQTIKKYIPDGAFDVLLLGMGPDGHTCSLFPNHPLVTMYDSNNDAVVAPIVDSPKPPPVRITLTLPTINQTHNVLFVVTGDKSDALQSVCERPEEGLPSALVKATNTIFLVDSTAASKLKAFNDINSQL